MSEMYVFGSRAGDILAMREGLSPERRHPASDLDIAVEPVSGHGLSLKEKTLLAMALEDLFGIPRVDLVVLCEADPFLALEIIRGELLYCTDEDVQAEHELEILRRAGDLLPFKEERIRMVLEEGAR